MSTTLELPFLPCPLDSRPIRPDGSPGVCRALGRRVIRPLVIGLARVCGRVGTGHGILTYHRVSPIVPGFPAPTCNVTPTNFRAQLAGLLDRGYKPWPLRTVLAWAAAGNEVPADAFVVTFDDGYENVYRHAWPVLQELNVPATVFLATAYLGSDDAFPFDDWAGAGSAPPEAWRPLRPSQCAEMHASGLIELGCHTHTHQFFRGRPRTMAADLETAADALRDYFGLTDVTFAFPYGDADAEMVQVVRAAGRLCALTTEMDMVRPGADPFGWGRFNVTDSDTAGFLASYLGGWYSLFRRLGRVSFDRGGGRPTTEAPAPIEMPVNLALSVRAPARRWPGRGTLAVADQVVVSGASFATSVIVARALAVEDFGVYGLALSLTLIARSVLAELVSSPFTVYSARFTGDELTSYTGSTFAHYVVLTAVAVVGLLVAAWVLGSGGAGAAVVAVAGASPFLLVREYVRRVDLAQLEVATVLATDVAVAVVQIGGLLILSQLGLLTVGSAFVAVGASAAVGCVAWVVVRGKSVRVVRARIVPDWKHNWVFARWAVVGFLVGSTTPFILPSVIAVSVGEAATGVFVACVTLINVAGMYISGVTNYLTPRAAQAFAHGGVAELRRVLGAAGALFSLTLGGFFLAVVLAGDWPATLVYGPAYAGCGSILAVLALQVWVMSLGITAGNGLWAMDRARANAIADVCTVAVTIVAVALLLPSYGVHGAAVGALIGTTAGVLIRIAVLVRLMADARVSTPLNGGDL